MKNNIFLKLLSSMPIILILLYFIPFLGVCLILLRYFIYTNKKKISIPIFLIIVGIILLIPKGISSIFNIINFDSSAIPYFNDIVNTPLYNVNFIKYSKLLLIAGTIFLIINFVVSSLVNRTQKIIRSYINSQEKREYEISQKNDLIMKEKQEKAKNTNVVYCPYCGADNMLTSKNGTCKYCRRQIQVKD